MDPSFSQNLWVPFYTFQKSVGSTEPTEPTLTTPLDSECCVKAFEKLSNPPSSDHVQIFIIIKKSHKVLSRTGRL